MESIIRRIRRYYWANHAPAGNYNVNISYAVEEDCEAEGIDMNIITMEEPVFEMVVQKKQIDGYLYEPTRRAC